VTDTGEPYFDLTGYVANEFIQGTTSDQVIVKVAGGRNILNIITTSCGRG